MITISRMNLVNLVEDLLCVGELCLEQLWWWGGVSYLTTEPRLPGWVWFLLSPSVSHLCVNQTKC